jgi:hypothetical protein
MLLIDWLQTCDFIRSRIDLIAIRSSVRLSLENLDRTMLYALCGALIAIVFILSVVALLLYRQVQLQQYDDDQSSPMPSDYDDVRCHLPVYRYRDRVRDDFLSS